MATKAFNLKYLETFGILARSFCNPDQKEDVLLGQVYKEYNDEIKNDENSNIVLEKLNVWEII